MQKSGEPIGFPLFLLIAAADFYLFAVTDWPIGAGYHPRHALWALHRYSTLL
jgi:hypothetical protein